MTLVGFGSLLAGKVWAQNTVTSPPALEEGPYWVDETASPFFRSDLRANIDGTNFQAGLPLRYGLTVSQVSSTGVVTPLKNAFVYFWSANADGVYSDEAAENSSADTYLRGYQITNSRGNVQFLTIYPGWYSGRTTHIHLRVRSKYSEASSTSDGANTTQLFFPQATLDYIYSSVAPYNSKGKDTTTNVSDHVYTPETEGETELALAGDYANGYTATFTVRLPITAA